MRAEVIAIGDEIITGQRLDTNSQWLSQRLTEIGVEVAFHTTIGDRLADNIAAFTAAIGRVDVVVATGGLGPTADDLTREALAAATGVGLVRHEPSLEHIRRLFASRGRQMPQRNAVQADFPDGALPIHNEHGTAPGIELAVPRPGGAPCMVFALPGVPAEMKPMWFQAVAPKIVAARGAARVIRHRRIKCFGVGESQLEAMLPDMIARHREPLVGITVSDATITLRITASGPDDASCMAAIEPTAREIYATIGSIAFGEEDDELQDVVARLLRQSGKTIAVAEWATGGLLAHWLAAVEKAEQAFAGGLVATSLRQLERVIASDLEGAAESDPQVADAAAETARRMFGADYGLGVAAFPRDVDQADAHVCVSIATPQRMRRLRFGCASHPAIRQARTAKQALNALRLSLLS
ncbi:MAG: damage-inducible protein CinA [Planctomycetota bacterium]|nr:MAG: damage-inducible protein CinA [Planctomycetota bacterium]